MIEYIENKDGTTTVLLDKRMAGHIEHGERGWQYIPKGKSSADGGEFFASRHQCKRSVEGAQ